MEYFSKQNELNNAVRHDSRAVSPWIKVAPRSGFTGALMASTREFICFFSDFKTHFGEVKSFLSVKTEEMKPFLF